MAGSNEFLTQTSERADLNQYWFSEGTIRAFVEEIEDAKGAAALVSTPSIYFSLSEAVRARSKVLDFDRQWASDPGFAFYDFNEPEAVPEELHSQFDFVLVDPPFITHEVWAKYAATVRILLRPGGRVLCTTIAENADMMQAVLGLRPVRFRPSIPTLVYQYSVYTNYHSERLDVLNPEIDDEDWMASAQQQQAGYQVLRESCKPNVSAEEPLAAVNISKKIAAPAEDLPAEEAVPLSPEVELLTELRSLLSTMKRCTEAVNAPVQTAIRRRQAGGETATAASAKAEAALDAAGTAAAALSDWISAHSSEAASALGETPEQFAKSLEQDRFRLAAVNATISKARGDSLQSMAEYNDFALVTKQHSAAVFRLSNLVMDRIKTLKRQAAAAQQV
jgi:hypothetical protein